MARKKIETSESMRIADNSPVQLPEEPRVEVVEEPIKAEAAPEEPKQVDPGIEQLRKSLAEEKEARQRAERERNEAVQRAYKSQSETDEANRLFIDSTTNQVKSNLAVLENHLSEAMAAGDAARTAKIIREIASQENKLTDLELGHRALKEKSKEPPKPLDPVEAFASQLSPKSAAWVRAHPEYVTNPRLNQKMIAAHSLALADGLQADTDDYFSSVEDTLKIAPTRAAVEPEEEAESPFSEASGGRQRQSPAIPVSRNISPSGQSTKRTYRLSVAEVEAAKEMGMTPEEYARNRAEVASDPRYRSLYN